MPLVRPTCAFLLAVLALATSAPARSADASLPSAGTETVDVHRVRWPVVLTPTSNHPDACDLVDASSVEVFEDGEALRVTRLDRTRPVTVHAILVDMSISMRGRIEEARDAALAYVRALPDREPAVVVAFSDDPWLLAGPTTDRDVLANAILRMEIRYGTALWDALDATIRLLAPMAERKIVALVTDGEDSSSLASRSFDAVLDHASATPELSVFPIALKLSPRADRGFRAPKQLLRLLAQSTGGVLIDAPKISGIDPALRRLRALLDSEAWITYVPAPWGEGPRDETEKGHRDRALRIREAPGVLCNIRGHGPDKRRVGLPRTLVSRAVPVADGDEARLVFRIEAAPTFGASDAGHLVADTARRRVSGVLPSLATDSGLLFSADEVRRRSRPRTRVLRTAVHGTSAVDFEVPRLDDVRARAASVADWAALLVPDGGDPARTPSLLDGDAFLEAREALGETLFLSYPDLRAFAIDRIAAWRAPAVEAALAEDGSVPKDDALRARLHLALRASAEAPQRGEAARALAAWIGDLGLDEVAFALERRALAALLAAPAGSPEPEEARRWLRVREGLLANMPRAVRSRIVVPLVLAHDADQDVIGFRRIRLPQPGERGSSGDEPSLVPPLVSALRQLRAAKILLGGSVLVDAGLPRFEPAGGSGTTERRETVAEWTAEADGERVRIEVHLRLERAEGSKNPDVTVLCADSDAEPIQDAIQAAGLSCAGRLARKSN